MFGYKDAERIGNIQRYYNEHAQGEWDRFDRYPYEGYITTHMMDRYMRQGDTILDIGGGPGHYSIHYAKQGYAVTLLDLSEGCVQLAKKKARQQHVKIAAM